LLLDRHRPAGTIAGLAFGPVVKISAPAKKNLHCNAGLGTLPLLRLGGAYLVPPITALIADAESGD
jgi:hypothetical protein